MDNFSLGEMTGACHAPVSCRQESDDCSDFTESGCTPLGVVAVITFFCKEKNGKFFSLQNDWKIVQPVSQIPFKGDWGCFPNK